MKTINLQEQKVKFAELIEEFSEIPSPKRYHKAAFRYGLDNITTRASECLAALSGMVDSLVARLKERGEIQDEMPPAISQKIDEIIASAEEAYPDITQREKDLLVAFLFDSNEYYHGLYDSNGKINQEWVKEHLQDDKNWPEVLDIPFTTEMAADVFKIVKEDISDEEKHNKISALFHPGGKYEGYIQADGSVDPSKIINK